MGTFFALYEKSAKKDMVLPLLLIWLHLGWYLRIRSLLTKGYCHFSSSISTPACLGSFLPSPATIFNSCDQGTFSDDQVWSPSQLQPGGISSAPYPAEVRNYAETTP